MYCVIIISVKKAIHPYLSGVELQILKLTDEYNVEVANFMHKLFKQKQLSVLSDKIKPPKIFIQSIQKIDGC